MDPQVAIDDQVQPEFHDALRKTGLEAIRYLVRYALDVLQEG
jgi:hypothetical protein